MSFPQELIQHIHDVATCRLPHVYNGQCPDAVEGPDVRDVDCPACMVLIEVGRLLSSRSAHAGPQETVSHMGLEPVGVP